jgi:hypothetical protein
MSEERRVTDAGKEAIEMYRVREDDELNVRERSRC